MESLFNKVSRFQACKFIKKRLRDRCLFSCESCEIFKNTYFGEHLQTTTFAYQILQFRIITTVFILTMSLFCKIIKQN